MSRKSLGWWGPKSGGGGQHLKELVCEERKIKAGLPRGCRDDGKRFQSHIYCELFSNERNVDHRNLKTTYKHNKWTAVTDNGQ